MMHILSVTSDQLKKPIHHHSDFSIRLPIVNIHADSAKVPTEESAIRLLVAYVTHAEPAFVIHDNQGTTPRRLPHRAVNPHHYLRTIANNDLSIFFADLVRNWARNIAQVMLFAKRGSPVCSEPRMGIFITVVRVRWLWVPDWKSG